MRQGHRGAEGEDGASGGEFFFPVGAVFAAVVPPGELDGDTAEQGEDGWVQRAGKCRIATAQAVLAAKGDDGEEVEEERAQAGNGAAGAVCEGVHQRGLDGPAADGPTWVERERDSRGREEGSEDGEGAGEGVQTGVAAAHV